VRGFVFNRNKNKKGKKPNWCYVVEFGHTAEGKRDRLWKGGFATKQEAEAALAQALEQLRTEANTTPGNKPLRKNRPGRQSVADYLRSWLVEKEVRNTTLFNYRWIVNYHVIPAVGDILLCNLTTEHIRELYKQKKQQEYSLDTRQRIHGILRSALEDAVKKGLIARNPCHKELCPKPDNKPVSRTAYSVEEIDLMEENAGEITDGDDEKVRVMTDEELNIFLEAISGTRFYAAHLLAVRRGLRRGDVLGLKWRDIDFQRKKLYIRRSLVVCEGKLQFHLPKTERSQRTIHLSDELVRALKSHLKKQNEEKMRRRDTYKDYGLVFATIDGRPYDPNRFVSRHYKPHLKRAGLPNFRYHDLRHTAATMMLKSGVDIKVVSQVLGHYSEAFTLRVYGHVLPGMQEIALARYDNV